MKVKRVEIRYPTAIVEAERLRTLGHHSKHFNNDRVIVGAGELISDNERQNYGFPGSDTIETETQAQLDELGFGATLNFTSDNIDALWRGCVASWRQMIEGE